MEHITIDYEKNAKVAKIKDSSGRIQFIISLITFEQTHCISTPEPMDAKFLVKVKEITDLNVPQDIVRQHFIETDKDQAEKRFSNLLNHYETLVSSKDSSSDDIPEVSSVFNDIVNYHRISPDCCFNCVNSITDRRQCNNGKSVPRIFCNLMKNIRQYEYASNIFGDREFSRSPISVEVDFDGVCDNYSRQPNILDS